MVMRNLSLNSKAQGNCSVSCHVHSSIWSMTGDTSLGSPARWLYLHTNKGPLPPNIFIMPPMLLQQNQTCEWTCVQMRSSLSRWEPVCTKQSSLENASRQPAWRRGSVSGPGLQLNPAEPNPFTLCVRSECILGVNSPKQTITVIFHSNSCWIPS